MEGEVVIEQVGRFSPELGKAIRSLVANLGTPQELSDETMQHMLAQECYVLIVARDEDTIIGMTSLVFYRIPYRTKGWIEDVAVDTEYRGKGIGTLLLKKAIEIAKEKQISSLNLTSSDQHSSAHGLYEQLGFKKRETNVYRLMLASNE